VRPRSKTHVEKPEAGIRSPEKAIFCWPILHPCEGQVTCTTDSVLVARANFLTPGLAPLDFQGPDLEYASLLSVRHLEYSLAIPDQPPRPARIFVRT
jgi:hypothetical protein